MKVLVFFVAVFALLGFLYLNTSENVALRSIKGFADDILQRDEISPIVETLDGGSVNVSLDSIVVDSEELLEDSFISGKVYFSSDAIMLHNFNSEIDGIKIAGSAYVSNDVFYVEEEHILEGAYGAKFSTLADELKDSIFAPDSGSDYEMDEEVFDLIIDALENTSDSENFKNDAEKLLKKVGKDIVNIVLDNAEIEAKNTTVRLNGDKTKVRQIIITIDEDAMQDIVVAVYDYFCESQDIVNFINEYEDTIIFMLGDAYDDDEYDSLEEAYEELLEDMEDDIDDMCDSIDEDFEDITVKIATPSFSAKLLKLEIESDDETVFVLDCGKEGIKETDTINISIADELDISYEVKKSGAKSFEAEFSVEDGYNELNIHLNINKEKGNYTLKYEDAAKDGDYSDKYTIKGSYAKKDDSFKLSIDTITNKYSYSSEFWGEYYTHEYENECELSCDITIDTNDPMPEPIKDYKSISEIKEKEVDAWIEKLEDIA